MASSTKEVALRLKAAAEAAIGSIGLGYDVTEDLRLKYCKGSAGRLIGIDDEIVRDVVVPGGILIQNVSKSINCGKGERVRFSSDIWSFQKMAEQFNQDVSLSGRIPTGQFNAAFEFTGSWAKDAANTKTLALDGVYLTLYNITLEKSQIALQDHVKNAVPSTWEPAALAKFIEKYGTHVIAGVKMGGKDIVYMKQQHSSTLPSDDVQRKLKEIAEKRFSGQHIDNPSKARDLELLEKNDYGLINLNPAIEDITFFWRRRGGSYAKNLDHRTWCQTVQLEPEVISISFIPITSLLSGIDGNGFLTHAINLYIRYKPPIEELQQFLEFQLPTRWAPEFGVLAVGPEGKQQHNASLQFKFMGPKLYVNTNQVDVGNTPVTGLRLYLEGKRNDCLAVHLQHLSSVPKSFKLVPEPSMNLSPNLSDRRYHEKVQWKSFSHICTLTITGKVDPTRIKERVEFKTKKKVDLVSPQPKKDGGEDKKKDTQPEKKPDAKKSDEKKPEDKKPKEPQSSTVVLKIPLHCDGCIHKIKRQISKIDGVEAVIPESGKDLVTVKGTMNMKELVPHLKEKFKRNIDVVPPKKEENKGGAEVKDDKKEKNESGGDKMEKKEGVGDGDARATSGGENKNKSIEVVNKLEYQGHGPYTHTMPMYNQSYYNQGYNQHYNEHYYNQDYGVGTSSSNGNVYQGYNHRNVMDYSHAPPPLPPPSMYINDPQVYQADTGMFSDENPNACSVM